MLCSTLARNYKPSVDFDPANSDHRKAFLSLLLGGQQHESLRFFLNQPFSDIVSMALTQLALNACSKELSIDYGTTPEVVLQRMKALLSTDPKFIADSADELGDKVVTSYDFTQPHRLVGLGFKKKL